MDRKQARLRIEQLRGEILRHNHLYYQQGQSEISDQEYDQLDQELQDLEAAWPEFQRKDSPTARVGSDSDENFPSETHSCPMLSLQNSYDLREVEAFDQRVRRGLGQDEVIYTVEPKMDGVAVAARYREGKLALALTRGDGRQGDVITANVASFREIPLELPSNWRDFFPSPATSEFEIRGEAYFTLSRFSELNEQRRQLQQPLLANPRNATAGTLKTLDTEEVRRRGLSIFFYQIFPLVDGVRVEENLSAANEEADLFAPKIETIQEFPDHQSEMKALASLGLPTNPFLRTAAKPQDLASHLQELESLRGELDYQIDGAVIKVDSRNAQSRLKSTAKAPRWGLAFKFAAEQADTTLKNITLQVGRTRVITPVAELEPVSLAGSTVSRATLHNWDEMGRKDIRPGDQVVVVKGGDIIPKILQVVLDKRTADHEALAEPAECPVCGQPVSRDEQESALRCQNLFCPAVVAGRMRHFVSRDACDIEGLGGQSLDLFLELELIKSPADLFRLKRTTLATLPGWGEKSADRVLNGVAQAASRPWESKIFAMGMPQVGVTTARTLASEFPDIEALKDASKSQLAALPDVGSTVAGQIHDYLKSAGGSALVADLTSVGFFLETETSSVSAPVEENWFSGVVVVITGTLESMGRSQARKAMEALGAKVTGSVTGKTQLLVAGEKAGSKLKKAEELGVEVLNEEAFLVRLAEARKASGKGQAIS